MLKDKFIVWHQTVMHLFSVQHEVLPDRFVVCGESYKDLRELLAEIVIGKDVEALNEKVQVISIQFHSLNERQSNKTLCCVFLLIYILLRSIMTNWLNLDRIVCNRNYFVAEKNLVFGSVMRMFSKISEKECIKERYPQSKAKI